MKEMKAGLTCNTRVLAQILGQRTYSNSVLQVAVKELLQNSVDACKPLRKGQINITLGSGENPKSNERGKYLLVTDNGIGMSPETVVNIYLQMGGTLKEGLEDSEKSGGFGIAKIQYLTQSEAIEITSIRDGVKTSIVTTPEELFTNETIVSTEETDEPNGTSVKVWYPSNLDIYWPYQSYKDHFNLDIPILGYPEIEVFYKSEGYDPVQVCLLDPEIYTAKTEIDFDWGLCEVFYAPQQYSPSRCGEQVLVMSAGIFQFRQWFSDSNGNGLRFNTIINLKSKVDAHDLKYPINNSREGFSPSIAEDVKTIQKYLFDIQRVLNSELIRQQYANLGSLEYVKVDATKANVQFIQPRSPKLSKEFLAKVAVAFSSCSSIYEEKEQVKEAKAVVEAAQKSEMTAKDNLRYNNRTTGLYAGCEVVFSKVASVIADTLESYTKDAIFPGIIIQERTRGTFLKSDTISIFINPLFGTNNGEVWVDGICEAVVHELAHREVSSHGESHNTKMRSIRDELIRQNILFTLQGKLRTIYTQHSEDLIRGEEEFIKSSPI